MGKDEETEELIKIFVTSIKTAEKKPRLGVVECSVLDIRFSFDVGRSTCPQCLWVVLVECSGVSAR